MGEGATNKSSFDAKSITLDILAKFALALSKTKDALISDLKEKLPKDDISEEGIQNIIDYLDDLLKFLGFDVGSIIPEEIIAVSSEIITLTEDLTKLGGAIGETTDIFSFLEDQIGEGDDENLGGNVGDLIQNTISLIKAFKKLGNIQLDKKAEAWKKLLKESNLQKELPKRLFDHILSVFLRNALEIFADDIKKLKNTISDEVGEGNEDLKVVYSLLDQVVEDSEKGFEESIKTASKDLREALKTIKNLLADGVFQELEEVEKKLKSLATIIQFEEYFKRVYTVLDFMQVISQEKVQITSIGNSTTSLSTAIYVIHWDRFEEMAKNPINYYKSRYPVNNREEAEELFKRILLVARAFGLDFVDFDSIKDLLMELLKKMEKWLLESINTALGSEINNVIEVVKNFLMVLERFAMEASRVLNAKLETILGDINSEIGEAYKVYSLLLTGGNDEQLKEELGEEVFETTKELISDINIKAFLGETEISASLETILLPVILQKTKEYKEFSKITEAEWKELLLQIAKNFLTVINDTKTELSEFSLQDFGEDIVEALKTELEKQTKDIPKDLDGLINKIQDSPANLSPAELFSNFEISNYFKIIGEKIKETAAPFNPDTYYNKFIDTSVASLNAILGKNSSTATKFKNVIEGQDIQLLQKTFVSFMGDVLISTWKELSKEIINASLKPFLQIIEAILRAKYQEILLTIINLVKKDVGDIKQLLDTIPQEYKDFADKVFPILQEATQEGINKWQDGVELAIKIGKPFYTLIDGIIEEHGEESQKAKQKAENVKEIPEIPNEKKSGNKKVDLASMLPSYSLDTNNKFLSIVLYDTRKNGKKDDYFAASLNIFIADRADRTDSSKETQTGIYMIPVIEGSLDSLHDIGKKHQLKFGVQADLNNPDTKETNALKSAFQKGAIGIFFTHKNFEWLHDTDSISASAELAFSRKETAGAINIIKSTYLDFSLGNYPQTISLGYKKSDFYFKYKGEAKEGEIILKLREVNDFFAELLKEDITTKFNFSLIYDSLDGFKFDGSASLKLDFNTNVKIADVFTLNKIGLEMGPAATEDSSVSAMITTSFTIDTEVIKFSVQNLKVGAHVNYLKDDGSLGDFELSPVFGFPTGMSVYIDASAVKGTGVISYNKEKEEFLGVLDLKILDKVEVKALALLTMKMPDGGKGFSFVGLISVYFIPGIPLGMGFSLTGLGGAIGLNRGIDRDTMQNGVRKGEITTVFFVEDIEDHMDTMLTQIGSYFPIKRNQFFFGILARISYTEIMNIEFGLLLQAPSPTQILIVGGLFINLPTKEKALVKINVYFDGGIDFDEGMWFNASLVNSELVKIQLFGDIAFRLNWGKNKGFLLSAGGFHPAFKPDAAFNLGTMARLGMKIDYDIVKMTFESYFAITSNTVQLGAQVDIKIGWDNVGLYGYFGFDCLFQFKPFRFIFDVRMGVEARWGSWTLLSVNLTFSLSGPAKWNAKGHAKFKILFFPFEVGFNISWGSEHKDSQINYISTYELISNEYFKTANWTIIASKYQSEQVKLAEPNPNEKAIIMQPFDGIQFEQPMIPFLDGEKQILQRYGEGIRPVDYSAIRISKVQIGSKIFEKLTETNYDFAPSLLFDLDDNAKLARPSYEKMPNGVKVENGLKERLVSNVKSTEIEYIIEQDEITFISGGSGFMLTDAKTGTKQKRMNEPITNENKAKRGLALTTGSAIQAFTNISNRSENGFKRHVSKMQRLQVEINNKKIDEFLKDSEKENVIVEKDKSLVLDIKKSKRYNRSYGKLTQAKEKAIRKNPSLRGKIFIIRK